MNKPLIIDYYTDALCVWAWIAQRRIDELNKQLGDKIELRYHYIDVFGDVADKMETQWKERGGYNGFAQHVQQSAATFEDVPTNPKIWTEIRPATSANAHLIIKAVELSYGTNKSADMALLIRNSFFNGAQNIGELSVLYQLVYDCDLDLEVINTCVNDGTAMAALLRDYQQARQQTIKGSPSYVIDGGRQILYGNVGYRVILSNIEQHLKHPAEEASWC
ncbi:MAG: putative DsbA family dithiol-disulfide isomerase [Moritella dasanensis]|jgi:predicted DsbA family dithiol-disulfide isomerase